MFILTYLYTITSNMVIRGNGFMKKPCLLWEGALLNIILDLILMKLMEKYAIEGAALATITAQLVQTIITLHYFNHNNRILN